MDYKKFRVRDLFAGIVLTPAATSQKKKRGRPAKQKTETEPISQSKEKPVADTLTKEAKPKEDSPKQKSKAKENIPRAVREQVWLTYVGPHFKTKCLVEWCKNEITVFEFHTGHNIPEKNGGTLDLANLRPICSRCNLSMGSQYTITEWNKLLHFQEKKPSRWKRFLCWRKNRSNLFT